MIKLYEKINLKGNALINYKKDLQQKGFTQEQKDILIGTLLGDASMEITKENQNSNIKWEQNISNESYINHIYEIFYEWVGIPPTIRNIKGGNAQLRQSIWFKTYRHCSLNFYKNQFYKKDINGKQYKIVPKLIHRWLTPRALAYWFMDDGSYNKSKNDYYLHTQGFSLKDVETLRKALNTKHNIKSNIHKDRNSYKLYILKESNETLKKTIIEYLLPCFFYKLHSSS